MKVNKIIISLSIVSAVVLSLARSVYATSFDLIAPSDMLTRGQEVRFTINIDTQGASLTSTTIGMTYDTQFLEFLNAIPGDTFTTINVNQLGGGKFTISGLNSSDAPYSGSGVYAYVNFRIIATTPGSTEVCALFNPSPTPSTVAPTNTPQPTSYSQPQPTAIPKSGENKPALYAGILGLTFLLPIIGSRLINKSSRHK